MRDRTSGNRGRLTRVEERLVKDLEETTRSLNELRKKYGVTKQAISRFIHRKGIQRRKLPVKEHIETCSVCQGLLRIARQEHSDFISSPTIQKRLKVGSGTFRYHIRILRKKGLVSQWFGRIWSRRVERAYQIYFSKALPISTIGRRAGLRHFYSVIGRHKRLGWDVPPALFEYDTAYRRKSHLKKNKRRRTGVAMDTRRPG